MVTKESLREINSGAREDLAKIQTQEGYIASAENQNFGVFFARDAAIDSIFTVSLFKNHSDQPEILTPVRNSLITMALTQGRVFDPWRDEEPGKIIHEYRHKNHPKNQQRLTELASNFPVEEKDGLFLLRYYGSVDATPLFEWVSCEYLLITGDEEFFNFLDPHIRAAFEWSRANFNNSPTGFVTYSAKNREALLNHGWKDSSNSILTSEGERPTEPIALVEVQGYQYRAFLAAAVLYQEKDPKFAQELYEESQTLKQQFNKYFWMGEEEFFAYALDGNGDQIKEITSNVGHLLITGLVDDEDKIQQIVKRLMQPDMFTKWGIRTLSVNSPNFSDLEPAAYHNGGGVWTHDNAIIYEGLKSVGFAREAAMIRDANLEAQYILKKEYGVKNPELKMVDRFGNLRPYKTAQQPQSWTDLANLLWTDPAEINSLMLT